MFIVEEYTNKELNSLRSRTYIGIRVSLSGNRLIVEGDVTGVTNVHIRKLGFKQTSPAFAPPVYEKVVNKNTLRSAIVELDKLVLVYADEKLAAHANEILSQ